MVAAPPITCAKHHRRSRLASCSSCEAALCAECVVHTSVGIKCRKCTGVRSTAPRAEGGTGSAKSRRWPVPVAVLGAVVAVAALLSVVGGDGGGGSSEGAADGDVLATAVDRRVELVGAHNLALGATLTLPAGAGAAAVPAALIVPGGATLDRNSLFGQAGGVPDPLYDDLSQAVVGSGMAVLRYDRRGTDRARPPADQPLAFGDFVADAQAGVEFLAQRREVAGAPLALIGYDDGGLVALRVAAQDPRVKAVVLISTPGRPLVDYLADDFVASDPENGPALASALRAAVTQVVGGRVPPESSLPPSLRDLFPSDPSRAGYLREIFTLNPANEARAVRAPVLFVRGGRDTAITDADVAALRGALSGGTEVLVGPAAGHSLLLPVSHGAVVHQGATETPRDADVLTSMGEWLRVRLTSA